MADKNNALEHHHDHSAKGVGLYQIGKWGAIAIITYYLLIEHRAHVLQFLPYLLLLACPRMHIFMHGGHKHHNPGEDNEDKEDKKEQR